MEETEPGSAGGSLPVAAILPAMLIASGLRSRSRAGLLRLTEVRIGFVETSHLT